MKVGVLLPTLSGYEWDYHLELARFAEEAGADSVWVPDHLYGVPVLEAAALESWSVLSAVAASTEKVELGHQVLCQSFRNPALVAKIVSTVDRISGGRLRLVIGGGWLQPEYEANGYEFPPASVRFEQTRDALRILKGLLNTDGPFTYEGRHYRVTDALHTPLPIRQPMPVELGAVGDRMLRLIAREADGWNAQFSIMGVVEERIDFLRRACEEAGRPFGELHLSCLLFCAVGDDEAATDPRYAMLTPALGIVGSVDRAVERVGELMELGIREFNLILPTAERGRAVLERFLGEVRPQLVGAQHRLTTRKGR